MARNRETPDQPMLIETDTPEAKRFRSADKAVRAMEADADNMKQAMREKRAKRAEAAMECADSYSIKPDGDGRRRFSVDGRVIILTTANKCIVRDAKEPKAKKAE